MVETISSLIKEMRRADDTRRQAIYQELTEWCGGESGRHAREVVESMMKGEVLEVQWDLEEILEATKPVRKTAQPEPEPTPPPADPEEDADRPLTNADLNLVYDDPRGLMLHRTKDGKRWFATQVDPRTRQPQTFELHAQEIAQLKAQLRGSPYWLLGR